MRHIRTLAILATVSFASPSQAGNTSSNSSSNSSNGVHTRVDTIVSDDGRGRRVYEHRVYRQRDRSERPVRRWQRSRDDD